MSAWQWNSQGPRTLQTLRKFGIVKVWWLGSTANFTSGIFFNVFIDMGSAMLIVAGINPCPRHPELSKWTKNLAAACLQCSVSRLCGQLLTHTFPSWQTVPWTVNQNKPFLLKVAFVPYHCNRKRNREQQQRRSMFKRKEGGGGHRERWEKRMRAGWTMVAFLSLGVLLFHSRLPETLKL